MVNRYAGRCPRCGKKVAAQTGVLRRENKRWACYHEACADMLAVLDHEWASAEA